MSLKDLLKYSRELSVLYVEDEEVTLELYTHVFKDIFLSVDAAANGIEALDKYLLNEYDIVISDLCMPQMGGIDLCRKIIDKNPLQNIIIMTAYNDAEPLNEIQKLGITALLSKPIQHEELIKILYKTSKKAHEMKLSYLQIK